MESGEGDSELKVKFDRLLDLLAVDDQDDLETVAVENAAHMRNFEAVKVADLVCDLYYDLGEPGGSRSHPPVVCASALLVGHHQKFLGAGSHGKPRRLANTRSKSQYINSPAGAMSELCNTTPKNTRWQSHYRCHGEVRRVRGVQIHDLGSDRGTSHRWLAHWW
jgi:hypothetical protein